MTEYKLVVFGNSISVEPFQVMVDYGSYTFIGTLKNGKPSKGTIAGKYKNTDWTLTGEQDKNIFTGTFIGPGFSITDATFDTESYTYDDITSNCMSGKLTLASDSDTYTIGKCTFTSKSVLMGQRQFINGLLSFDQFPIIKFTTDKSTCYISTRTGEAVVIKGIINKDSCTYEIDGRIMYIKSDSYEFKGEHDGTYTAHGPGIETIKNVRHTGNWLHGAKHGTFTLEILNNDNMLSYTAVYENDKLTDMY